MNARVIETVLVLFLWSSMAWAADGPPPTALLRVHADLGYGGHGFTRKDQELFVMSSRLVTVTLTSNDNASPWANYWFASTQSKVASASSFADLKRALVDNHIGTIERICSVSVSVVPTQGAYDITWFSGGRRKAIHVEIDDPDLAPCAPEMANLINSILTFARANGIDFGLPVD
jgi:hypothetical protein